MQKRVWREHHSIWGYGWRGVKLSILLVCLMFALCFIDVYQQAKLPAQALRSADAAVILGAAAWDKRPSPVFRERINHALNLYQSNQVESLIFTGGTPKQGFMTEAEVGRRYALQQGIPARDIYFENLSRDTYQNLFNTRIIMRNHNIQTIIIVSDPYHMARAAAVARNLGLDAQNSPTPTSRFNQSQNRWTLLGEEAVRLFLFHCWRVSEHFEAWWNGLKN